MADRCSSQSPLWMLSKNSEESLPYQYMTFRSWTASHYCHEDSPGTCHKAQRTLRTVDLT